MCSLDTVVVCPKPRDEWVRPTKVGQRVLVCAGQIDLVNLVGKVVSIGVEKCSLEVKDDSGARSVSGVKLEYLHVLHEKPSSESDDGPVFVGKTYTVKVSEVKEWLQNYQLENNVDLVLHKTNETCSNELLGRKLVEAIALATNRQEMKEAQGIETLMALNKD